MKNLFKDEHGEVGALVDIAIGLTILMIVLGYIFAPVGLSAFGATNKTTSGLGTVINTSLPATPDNVANTTAGNIWDAIVPVSLAVIILLLVVVIKKAGQ